MKLIFARDGLIFRDDRKTVIPAPEADAIAQANGCVYAERFVKKFSGLVYLESVTNKVLAPITVESAMIDNSAELHCGPRRLTRDVHGYYTVSGASKPKPRQTTGFRFRYGANVIYNGANEFIALTVLVLGEEKAREIYSW